jgi:hypothetical protein
MRKLRWLVGGLVALMLVFFALELALVLGVGLKSGTITQPQIVDVTATPTHSN